VRMLITSFVTVKPCGFDYFRCLDIEGLGGLLCPLPCRNCSFFTPWTYILDVWFFVHLYCYGLLYCNVYHQICNGRIVEL
jgi:hypothetical protein